MRELLLNIILAFTWMFLTGNLMIHGFIEGALIGYAILWITKDAIASKSYFIKIPTFIGFIFYFLYLLI